MEDCLPGQMNPFTAFSILCSGFWLAADLDVRDSIKELAMLFHVTARAESDEFFQ